MTWTQIFLTIGNSLFFLIVGYIINSNQHRIPFRRKKIKLVGKVTPIGMFECNSDKQGKIIIKELTAKEKNKMHLNEERTDKLKDCEIIEFDKKIYLSAKLFFEDENAIGTIKAQGDNVDKMKYIRYSSKGLSNENPTIDGLIIMHKSNSAKKGTSFSGIYFSDETNSDKLIVYGSFILMPSIEFEKFHQ